MDQKKEQKEKVQRTRAEGKMEGLVLPSLHDVYILPGLWSRGSPRYPPLPHKELRQCPQTCSPGQHKVRGTS